MSTLQQNWRKKQNRFCLKVRGMGRERKGGVGRNDSNNVFTYEMNKGKKKNPICIFCPYVLVGNTGPLGPLSPLELYQTVT
jgi:hypothetical protein